MACVAGEREQHSRRFYPSPSSSPENAPSPITVAQSRTSGAAKHQLHTPASSIDSTLAPPSACNVSLSPQISTLVNEILAAKRLDTDFLELTVPREIWPDLSEEVPEDLGARLRYSADTEKLILKWPTEIHGSYTWITDSFLEAKRGRPEFVSITNTPIPFSSGPHTGSTLTPDFAFGKVTSDAGPQYSIIVESALSQPLKDLEKTAEKHLTRPEVACVIGLNFVTPSFNYPDPSPTSLPRLAFPDFRAAAKVSLRGGVEFRGVKWAPPIDRIEMIIWFKKQGTVVTAEKMKWDVTPIGNDTQDPNLVQCHTEILDLIRRITRTVLTKSIFKIVYPAEDSFTIDWQGFYDDIEYCLLLDAFRRWLNWAFKRSPTLRSPNELDVKINELPREDLKRRAAQLYPDSDEERDAPAAGTAQPSQPVPTAEEGKDGYL